VLFNTLVFGVFFAVVWPAWWVLPPRVKKAWLLLASFVFYGWWDWRFLSLLLLSGLVDFFVAAAMPDDDGTEATSWRRRRLLTTSVVVNLSILGTFKYLGFFSQEAARLLSLLGVDVPAPTLDIILPVGLSFYTFQSMAYTIDVYRGAKPTRSLLDFLCYLSFFPQLVAGPIERAHHLLPQLEHPRRPSVRFLQEGLLLFVWGLFKKVVVADNLSPLVERVFDQGHGGAAAVLLAAYAFTWQIYCDFSGYSDMARGLARCFGVDVMVNFARPFFAASPRELWRRWHISLSRWLRDYLYIPLGGSRQGAAGTMRNLMLTMLLGGLWHGANWTFLVWGGVHGAALALQRALGVELKLRWGLRRLLLVVATFHLTAICFVIFRAHDLGQVGSLAMSLASIPLAGLQATAEDLTGLRLLALLAGVVLTWEIVEERNDDPLWAMKLPGPVRVAGYALAVLLIVVMGGSYGQPFIYFQF